MLDLNNYREAFDALPESWKSDARSAALNQFLQSGFPNRKVEAWKYLDLSGLGALPPSTALGSAEPESMVEPDSGNAIDALNFAFHSGGINVETAKGEQPAKVIVADGSGHRRHRISLGENSCARVSLEAATNESFQTIFLDCRLAAGAKLQILRSVDLPESSHLITRIRVKLERDASVDISHLDIGGALSRHDVEVKLEGPGASVDLRGLFIADKKSVIDNHTRFDHLATHGVSRELVRGLASDRGRGIFNGSVIVHPGAMKTDSEQRIANLILSPTAEINAKPELEIYADDVKCAHGATFGQLDEKALFYLRSRGMPEADARALLTLAFAVEPLRAIPDPEFRQACLRAAGKSLAAGSDEALFS